MAGTGTPSAATAWVKRRRLTPSVDLRRRPDLKDLYVKPHSPETYDELTRRDDHDSDDESD